MFAPTAAARLAERERPEGPPVLHMRWARLMMLHWTWDAADLQRTLPAGLTVDTHDGRAWLAVVVFFMQRTRPRGFPVLPGLSNFLEVNVRSYVFDNLGRPGVWFYSLDANQWLAVTLARAWYHLPYQHAAMTGRVEAASGAVDCTVRRRGAGLESRFAWRVTGAGREAVPGTREFFFTERYRLFAQHPRNGGLHTAAVWHPPYRLAPVELTAWDDRLPHAAGFEIGARAPDQVCAAETVDVDAWPLTRVHAAEGVPEPESGALGAGAMPA